MHSDNKQKEGWLHALNKVVNAVVFTTLIAIVFGFFATFGAIYAINILN